MNFEKIIVEALLGDISFVKRESEHFNSCSTYKAIAKVYYSNGKIMLKHDRELILNGTARLIMTIIINEDYYKKYEADKFQFVHELFEYNKTRMCRIIIRDNIDHKLKINAKIILTNQQLVVSDTIICESICMYKFDEENLSKIHADYVYEFNNIYIEKLAGKVFSDIRMIKVHKIIYLNNDADAKFTALLNIVPNVIYIDCGNYTPNIDCLFVRAFSQVQNNCNEKMSITLLNTNHYLSNNVDKEFLAYNFRLEHDLAFIYRRLRIDDTKELAVIGEHHIILENFKYRHIKWMKPAKKPLN